MKTRLTERFGIQHPIVSAPMGLVSGGQLASAVSAAGGLGFVGAGYAGTLGGEPDLHTELKLAQSQRFGVGFITWALAEVPHVLDEVLEYNPSHIFLSFGDPAPFARRIRDGGAELICQVQSLDHVRQALDADAVAIVAQGTEAGGHGAKRSTFPFVPEVADYLAKHSPKTLLLAAGGIADGRGLAAALILGADGVVIGSRFWSSEEALTPRNATDEAILASGDDTVRTTALDAIRGVPWPEEFSFRVVKNSLTNVWADKEQEAAASFGSYKSQYAEARARHDFDIVAIVAGECVGLINDRPTAASIIEQMVGEAEAQLKRGTTIASST
jgi:nitronate monooxygenase